jgi:hypothetical protein
MRASISRIFLTADKDVVKQMFIYLYSKDRFHSVNFAEKGKILTPSEIKQPLPCLKPIL